MQLAPIAVFIFNRPDHLRKTLCDLQRCNLFSESKVVVFGDGPRTIEQRDSVDAARAVAYEILGDRAEYRFSERNIGLASSIIAGVSDILRAHGRIIVIEDDLRLNAHFLEYMNSALEIFSKREDIFQISGHQYNVPEFVNKSDVVLLPFITTWGWGTWSRAWDHFSDGADGAGALEESRALRHRFNLFGVYDYASMMRRQRAGKIDSWGIRWYWTVFQLGGFSVFPPVSLVQNCGFDGSGSHGAGLLRRFSDAPPDAKGCPSLCPNVLADSGDFASVRRAIFRQNGKFIGYIADLAKRAIRM